MYFCSVCVPCNVWNASQPGRLVTYPSQKKLYISPEKKFRQKLRSFSRETILLELTIGTIHVGKPCDKKEPGCLFQFVSNTPSCLSMCFRRTVRRNQPQQVVRILGLILLSGLLQLESRRRHSIQHTDRYSIHPAPTTPALHSYFLFMLQ